MMMMMMMMTTTTKIMMMMIQVMKEAKVNIVWPSKLKIGAKSKKGSLLDFLPRYYLKLLGCVAVYHSFAVYCSVYYFICCTQSFFIILSTIKDHANQPPTIQPPTMQPPTIQPPTIQPPTIQPPTIQPPTMQPPTIQPPTIQPPTIQPPTI